MRKLAIWILLFQLLALTCNKAEARDIKQSTAANMMVFMTDSTDHVSGKASLTLTITASKDGAAFASITPTVIERGTGWYNLALSTTDTNTLGDLALHITATGADPTDIKHTIVANVEADTYAEVTNTSYGLSKLVRSTTPANTLDVATTGEAGVDFDNIKGGLGAAEIDADAIGSSEFAQAAADKVWGTATRALTDKDGFRLSATGVDDIWDEAQSGHITAGTFGKYLDEAISGIDDNPWDNATRTLTAFGFSVDLSAGAVDAIWDEAQSGHVAAGTFGKYLDEAISGIDDNPWDNLTRTITGGTINTNNDKTGYSLTQSFPTNFASLAIDTNGRMDLGKWLGLAPNALISGRVDANAQVVGDKSGYSLTQAFPANFSAMAITLGGAVTVGTNNDKTGYSLTSAEQDLIVDKIWDEAIAGHLTAGTTGSKLNAAGGAGDPWSATLPGSYTGSQAGKILSNINDATDGDKEGTDYTGIEKTIRAQR